jgi:Arc/MetJ-type ribon-helix-helix transcriptional regulator
LSGQWQNIARLIPSLPSEEELDTLNQLAAESVKAREGYSSSCEAIREAAGELQAKKLDLEGALRAVEDALTEGTAPDGQGPSLSAALEKYAEKVRELPGVSNGYAASYAALDPAIRSRLTSEDDVRFLGVLIDGLERWSDIRVSFEINRIVDELQELVRQCRQLVEVKQKQILGLRDKEIKTWYQLLSGSAEVGYSGIIPGTDNLELRAYTFAKGMMAAPNLSASQLNCIGLAVYLATCCRTGSPFKMVLFDDPIQSMDDEHTEAFKKQVISKLLSSGFQVILLSHMDNFVDDVERLYRQHAPLYYKLESYTESGPNVIWKGPEIRKLLNEVKKNKDAQNEGYRKESVQTLRQFVERFVKDIFTAESGQSVSKRFENKAWNELRHLLRQCQKFEAEDEAILEDTHTFTSRHLHTDGSLPHKVPSSHNINPHYESMKLLSEKYSKILLLD